MPLRVVRDRRGKAIREPSPLPDADLPRSGRHDGEHRAAGVVRRLPLRQADETDARVRERLPFRAPHHDGEAHGPREPEGEVHGRLLFRDLDRLDPLRRREAFRLGTDRHLPAERHGRDRVAARLVRDRPLGEDEVGLAV
jgi:hypothetical protein